MKIFKKKKILYPIFLEVSQLSKDIFWIYLFENLAYGITPFGTYIDNNIIYCRIKGKQFNFNFNNKTSINIFKLLKKLLQDKLKLTSEIDYYSKKKKFDNLLKSQKYANWKEIKKKNIRDILIENYVIEIKKNIL